jgi:hypothetical protein
MKTSTLPLAVLLAAASPAFAADHGMGKHDCPMHDSTLSDADRARHMDEMFAKLDADGNGAIDRAEFDKYHERMHDMHDMHEQQDKAAPAPAADEHADHH